MKTIKNKQIVIKFGKNKEGKNILRQSSYISLIEMSLENPPEKGFSPEEMKSRIEILEIIQNTQGKGKKAPEEIKFEDAQFNKIKECVNAIRWLSLDKVIKEFTEYINNHA